MSEAAAWGPVGSDPAAPAVAAAARAPVGAGPAASAAAAAAAAADGEQHFRSDIAKATHTDRREWKMKQKVHLWMV